MIDISVTSNMKQVLAEFRSVREEVSDKAVVRALNRALDQTGTAANREVRKTYNVRASAVSSAFKKIRAREKSTSPAAILQVSGNLIGLIEFDAKQNRAGVSVRIKTKGGRKTVAHAFIATNTHNGYTGVFRRVGRERYPIKNLRSISIPRAFRSEAVLKAVKEVAAESFTKNYRQQIQFLSSKK